MTGLTLIVSPKDYMTKLVMPLEATGGSACLFVEHGNKLVLVLVDPLHNLGLCLPKAGEKNYDFMINGILQFA